VLAYAPPTACCADADLTPGRGPWRSTRGSSWPTERTLLAWLRTALALLASGAAVQQFAEAVPIRELLAVLLAVMGTAAAATGGLRFRSTDRALRSGVLPVSGRAPLVLTAAVGAFGLVLAVVLAVAAL
jgi:putative membrane protein